MKRFLGVIITLACVMMMTVTAFAAEAHWEQKDGKWFYMDRNGEVVTEKWQKSGEDWFWLNEDGEMATATLVEDNDKLYCVNENGCMIKNNWVHVNNDDFEDRWLYFGMSGRAVKDGWKTINDKKYFFEGYAMNYGFLNADGTMIDAEDEPWKNAVYYCGGNDNGAMFANAWVKVDSLDADNGEGWVYFGVNGKKVVDCQKTINGCSYLFDADGLMKVSFDPATPSASASSITKYAKEDGSIVKKGWIWAYLYEGADEENWFYADAKGNLLKNCVKTINNKKYAFDDFGRMLTGIVIVNDDGNTPDAGGNRYMYFTESATPSEQGAAVVGKSAITVDDEKYTVNFNSRGIANMDGEQVKKGYYYINDVLQADEEAEYKYSVKDVNGTLYVINNKTAKASTKGTFTDSENDIKYVIKDGIVTEYVRKDGKWIIK